MNKIKTPYNIVALLGLLVMIVLTRSYNLSPIHLPDATLPALIISGIYLRSFLAPFLIITIAILVDNYAIFYQGVSANCITPAYSILLVLYYLVYYFAKFIPSLAINSLPHLLKTSLTITTIICLEWLLATMSYYAFSNGLWADFASYAWTWSVVEIPSTLYQLVIVGFVITFAQYVKKSARKSAKG